MPTSTWDIAVAELVYFVPAIFPVGYCLWRHRYYGLGAWFFLTAFVMLQIIGSGMIAGAGEDGVPSKTAIIITSVGMSPLILGVSGAVHEWVKMAGLLRDKSAEKKAMVLVVIYHLLVVAAIALYASGASNALGGHDEQHGKSEWRAGIVLLFVLWILLCAAFTLLAYKIGMTAPKALFVPLPISLLLLGLRVVYQMVATFNNDQGEYSMITGSTALKVIFDFLPGALIVAVMVVGGVTSLEHVTAARDFPRANIRASNEHIEVGNLANASKLSNRY